MRELRAMLREMELAAPGDLFWSTAWREAQGQACIPPAPRSVLKLIGPAPSVPAQRTAMVTARRISDGMARRPALEIAKSPRCRAPGAKFKGRES